MVDHLGAFVNITTDLTGSTHDAQIFWNFALPLESGQFMSVISNLQLGNVTVSFCLNGDSPYPLLLWFMWPYTGQLNLCQAHFSMCLEQRYVLIKCALRCLKGS